jgi:L-ascorbate metabolism protein UlaG (beta-lactamase superfamily)
MELTHIGHSCFIIKGKKSSVLIDPYNPEMLGYKLPKMTTRVLLNTHQHEDHNYNKNISYDYLFDTPGEFEIDDISITGVDTYHDNKEGKERGKNICFSILFEGVHITHLGDLGHLLDEKAISKIGVVDILLIPVGGHFTIDSYEASKVISSLEPKIVIPMHYQTTDCKIKELAPLDTFLHEMGEKNPEKLDSLKLQSAPTDDNLKIIILNPSH